MTSTEKTPLTLRAQARGGKFLGDDVGGASVVVRDALTSEVLATGITRGDSGTLGSAYQAGSSLQTIVTPGSPPAVAWLTATSTTSAFTAELPLERPTLIEVTAYGPLGGLQSARRATAVQWVVPGRRLPEPGWVIELPTHRQLATSSGTVGLAANVTMMCGCPIESGEPWIPSDFEVVASVRRAGSSETRRVPLAFSAEQAPSIFRGEVAVDAPGDYEVWLTAVQKSTGNAGAGLVTFIVPSG